jgi:WG containing repeat
MTNVNQLPAMQNLKKNSGLSLFGEPREGLQAAAKNGQLGYISRVFEWIIEPQYDFAFSFHEGYATVFLDGQAMYIDKQNKQPFKTDFAKHLGPFQNGRAMFKTHSGKMGMWDKSGRLLVDTIFKKIYLFDEDKDRFNTPIETGWRTTTVAISYKTHATQTVREVEGKLIKTDSIEHDYAIIDRNGRFIVPFGAFRSIEPHRNGYVFASDDNVEVLFDHDGKEVFRLKKREERDWELHKPIEVKDGLIHINFPTSDVNFSQGYHGLLNFKGEIVFKDTTVHSVNDFDDKKVLVYTDLGWKFAFYDQEKEKSNKLIFKDAPSLKNLKKYGVDAASIWEYKYEKEVYGIIDSCFNWKMTPQYNKIRLTDFGRNPYFTLTQRLTTEEAEKRQLKPRFSGHGVELYGLAVLSGKKIFETEFSDISPHDTTFQKFYFRSADGKKSGIMDRNKTILRENQEYVDTTSMQTAPRSVSQTFSQEEFNIAVHDNDCKEKIQEGLGVIKRCNSFKKIINSTENLTEIAQIIFSSNDTFYRKEKVNYEKKKVIRAQLMNTTNDTIFFKTTDNKLSITIQAKDKKGNWRDISIVRGLTAYEKQHKKTEPSLGLPPQYFWDIYLPTFNGIFKTQCRAVIKSDQKNAPPIVSKEWEAGINAAQFWKSPMYNPDRIFRMYGDFYSQDD